jgi:hypothetical protein
MLPGGARNGRDRRVVVYSADMSKGPALVTIGAHRHRFTCTVCDGKLFSDREVKVNTTGAEFFNMAWANQSATGLVCAECGYLHTFVSGVELWEPDSGYPETRD